MTYNLRTNPNCQVYVDIGNADSDSDVHVL